jgi:Flp pilus assembly protein TadD
MIAGLMEARRHFAARRFEKCLTTLAEAGDGALDEPAFWFLRAESLRQLGKSSEAISAARAGLERWPEEIGLLDSLGLALVGSGDLRGGDEIFRRALAIFPGSLSLLAHHATTLARLGKDEEAKHVIQSAMAIAPDSIVVLEAQALVASHSRDPAAGAYLDELVARDPENPHAHVLRGNHAIRRRRVGQAAKAFSEAAALDPENTSVARAARATRVASHPLLLPSRWILALGRRRAQFLYIGLIVVLLATGQGRFVPFVAAFWIVFLVILPRVLRLEQRRRYGKL